MLILGIVLLICGLIFALKFLIILGIVIAVVGALLMLGATTGHGRSYW